MDKTGYIVLLKGNYYLLNQKKKKKNNWDKILSSSGVGTLDKATVVFSLKHGFICQITNRKNSLIGCVVCLISNTGMVYTRPTFCVKKSVHSPDYYTSYLVHALSLFDLKLKFEAVQFATRQTHVKI